MAGASEIRAGRAAVEIGTTDTGLSKGLKDAQAKLSAFGSALQTLGAAVAFNYVRTKVMGWVTSFAEGSREVYLLSRQTGIAIPELLELRSVVQSLGGNMDETVTSMRKMGIFLSDFAHGGGEAVSVMRRLGISLADVAHLSETDKLQLIGERLSAIGNINEQQALARKIFGKSGAATASMASQLGSARGQIDPDALPTAAEIRAGYELSQSMAKFDRSVKSIWKTLGATLAPGFQAAYDVLVPIVKSAQAWLRANTVIVQQVAVAGAIILGVLAPLVAVAAVVKLIGFAWGGVAAILGGVKLVLVAILGLVRWALTPMGMFMIAFDLAKTAVLSWLGLFDNLKPMFATLKSTIGGVAEAIKNGDLGLAWEALIAGMKVAWYDLNDALKKTFGASMIDAFFLVRKAWAETVAFIRTIWDNYWNASQRHWTGVVNATMEGRGIGTALFGAGPNADIMNSLQLLGTEIVGRPNVSPDVLAATTRGQRLEQNAANRELPRQVAEIEAERIRWRNEISRDEADAPAAAARARAANQDVLTRIAIGSVARAAREAAEAGVAAARGQAGRGLDEFAETKATTRSTFNRDVLWGFGGPSPMVRLADIASRHLPQLALLPEINAHLQEAVPGRVG